MDNTPEEQESKSLPDKAAETYQWWDNLATIHAEDPFLVGAAKIGLRLFGVIVLLALSPVILLGLLIAFITVL
ncbi:hypothetical protein CLV84_1391 [Neolewinella xylanilytica]|uniref:Uncharacterized protein n=1 Tax=Neolewinella xylanilytica TaxID=1514080 RepID=A0A2S6IA98_9BACT|nr:hypothetical protein [Neolewinella xylanilytica]PPK88424.1 hypothetical protein CLV84_1391 [Neolewinella xylanilytica]